MLAQGQMKFALEPGIGQQSYELKKKLFVDFDNMAAATGQIGIMINLAESKFWESNLEHLKNFKVF